MFDLFAAPLRHAVETPLSRKRASDLSDCDAGHGPV